MEAVVLNSVSKSFGQVHAVDELSVSVQQGSVYGFLGPNGAGKTTTIRMIMDIIRPDRGQIHVLGNGAIKKVKSRIGYMPEERGLYRKMKVREILEYFGGLKGIPKKQLSQKIGHWLELIELTAWAEKKVEELSRGMHQKLQFAVTAINDPELLILDEPFSGLDPVNQEMLKDIITKMRSEGRTIIFSTHMMHKAERLCDEIILINNGRAVLQGNLAQIKSRYQPNAVSLESQGDLTFLSDINIVKKIEKQDGRTDIHLIEGADPQELLKLLAGRVSIKVFEVKLPSLHELFIEIVGGGDAKDS
jgi:ABC-2 type transport system ATP-binding protein